MLIITQYVCQFALTLFYNIFICMPNPRLFINFKCYKSPVLQITGLLLIRVSVLLGVRHKLRENMKIIKLYIIIHHKGTLQYKYSGNWLF